MGSHSRCNIVGDDGGDLFTDSHSILARRRNHFSQLLHVPGVNGFKKTEIHTTEPPASELSAFEFEMAIEKLKGHESPGIDQIPAGFIKAGVEKFTLRSLEILLLFGIRKNCMRSERSRSSYLFTRRVIKQIVVIIEAYLFCQVHSTFFQDPSFKVNSKCRGNYRGSSMWISRQKVNHGSYILHSSNT
jgi:hypothetical protein